MFSRAIRPVSAKSLQFVRFQSSAAYKDALALLKTDLKKAMLAKDALRKETIRGLMSAIKNKEIDTPSNKQNEFLLFDMYNKLIEQRKESIAEYEANNRPELVEKENQEINIIQSYVGQLPVTSIEEIEAKVTELIKDLLEQGKAKNTGEVMKNLNVNSLASELQASPGSVRSAIARKFKELTN